VHEEQRSSRIPGPDLWHECCRRDRAIFGALTGISALAALFLGVLLAG
jgi:hypothetical protein